MKRRTVILVAKVVMPFSVGMGLLAACSLGLDEGLMNKTTVVPDAGLPDTSVTDAPPTVDAAEEPPPFVVPDGGKCTTDPDCKANNACLKGRCDLTRGACVYDVCKPAACQVSACDTTAHTCGADAGSYAFHSGSFPVAQGGVGCGAVPSRCFAAVYPFVFVGTTNGVVAFSAMNPASVAPPSVPVTGLPFFPQQIVASGNRVYFVGTVVGTAPNSKVPIAWIDVPPDPFALTIPAKAVLANYSKQTVDYVFPAANDGVFLVNGAAPFPTTLVTAPIPDPATFTAPQLVFPAGENPVAASGTRLVMFQTSFTAPNYGHALFSFVTGAGTTSAANSGEVPATGVGEAYIQQSFAIANDGALAWSFSSATGFDGGIGPATVRAARLAWLVADAGSPTFDTSAFVDVEVYPPSPAIPGPPGLGGWAAGPAAWLDANTVIVTATDKGNLAQTSVQLATRTPPALVAGKRVVLPVALSQVGVAATNGIGYTLTPEVGNLSATVHVFAPSCP